MAKWTHSHMRFGAQETQDMRCQSLCRCGKHRSASMHLPCTCIWPFEFKHLWYASSSIRTCSQREAGADCDSVWLHFILWKWLKCYHPGKQCWRTTQPQTFWALMCRCWFSAHTINLVVWHLGCQESDLLWSGLGIWKRRDLPPIIRLTLDWQMLPFNHLNWKWGRPITLCLAPAYLLSWCNSWWGWFKCEIGKQ